MASRSSACTTGGLVAAELGRLAPGRVAAVLVDGYAWFTPEEQAELDERYLPPFEPRWDGSHLAWLWARLREQRLVLPLGRRARRAGARARCAGPGGDPRGGARVPARGGGAPAGQPRGARRPGAGPDPRASRSRPAVVPA
ncbi:MAG: hypothetical protein RML12_10830 [Xanthomonadales bacterium]|nr:hypothetical protein [Xanthomonadales bacterium]